MERYSVFSDCKNIIKISILCKPIVDSVQSDQTSNDIFHRNRESWNLHRATEATE